MIHELLLALSGLPGDLFVPFPDQIFKIQQDFPFLHEAEKSSLERLAVLGKYQQTIANFLALQRGRKECPADLNIIVSEDEEAKKRLNGSFVHALSNALSEVLKDFKEVVDKCEKRILNKQYNMGGVIPISQIVAEFGEYYIIFPHLNQLIIEINQRPEEYFGCRLLNLMVEKCNTGVPELRTIMLKLLQACNEVMYKHITSWMVYGYLQDPYGEFFVKDETFKDKKATEEQFNASRWHKRFVLDEQFIPKHLTLDIAKSILFVGKAIATVRNATKPYEKNNTLPRSLSSMHLQHLLELSSRTIFHQIELENTVTIIRNNVAQWLWQVVLTGDKIIECLEAFRNYFLLGQGDFAISLVEQFEKLKASRSRSSTIKEQELNSLLVRASIGTLAENDSSFEKFRFKIQNANDKKSATRTSTFDSTIINVPLKLEYDIEWPLDLFVTSEDLEKYGDIFSFLISLRRTQIRLQRVWTHLTATEKIPSGTNNILNDNVSNRLILWKVLSSMMFFIDCLWGHMQVYDLFI